MHPLSLSLFLPPSLSLSLPPPPLSRLPRQQTKLYRIVLSSLICGRNVPLVISRRRPPWFGQFLMNHLISVRVGSRLCPHPPPQKVKKQMCVPKKHSRKRCELFFLSLTRSLQRTLTHAEPRGADPNRSRN